MPWREPERVWEVPVTPTSRVSLQVKRHALSVSVDTLHVFTFDREGRPVGIFHAGRTYRRGLDHRVLEKWGGAGPQLYRRQRRWLSEEEKATFFATLRRTMEGVAWAVERGWAEVGVEGQRGEALRPIARNWMERILRWDLERLEAERARFQRVYKPVSILPPDQYLSLVVQVTEGCPWNRCTFCDFYRDRPYRVKDDAELEAHLLGIEEFLGEGMRLRKAVFLADANAVAVPQGRLEEMVRHLQRRLPLVPEELPPPQRAEWKRSHPVALDGFYSFVDAFTGGQKPTSAFAALRRWGMRRLYLGAETGEDELLRLLNKPTTREEIVDTVRRIKAGGLQVGVIFMVGVGGRRFAEAHERAALEALAAMPLEAGDIVYLSPFVVHPDLPYSRWMQEEGIAPLSPEEMWQQEQRLREGLRRCLPPEVRVAPYDIREFLY